MRKAHALEALLLRGLWTGARALSWRASLRLGARLGDLARALGIRRAVAEGNLALAFPDWSASQRAVVLQRHYRHLGQLLCEYHRLPWMVRAPAGEVVAAARGLEHLETVRREGRGAILLTGHYGSPELLGAWLGRLHPTVFVEKPLTNPAVHALHVRLLADSGVGYIPLGPGVRRVFTTLGGNGWVGMVADQDARGDGVFVPFMGRPSSTAVGPAALALRTGAPIVMGFIVRRPDGRYEAEVLPPLRPAGAAAPEAVRALTARHAAILEDWVRRHPHMWFWLHRRWKTRPPAVPTDGPVAAEGGEARPPASRSRPGEPVAREA